MNNLALNQKTMTSIELSKMLAIEKKSLHRKIKEIFRSEIDGGIITPSLDSRGYVASYLMPEIESKMLVARCDNSYLRTITEYWVNKSKTQHQIPQTFSEALKLASDQAKTIEKQIQSLENKDQLLLATNEASIKAGEILVREFVKSVDIIEIGEKLFYKWLRERKYITSKNEPYQEFVTRGYFTYKPSKEEINGQFRYTLRVTARGKVWLSNKYLEFLDGE